VTTMHAFWIGPPGTYGASSSRKAGLSVVAAPSRVLVAKALRAVLLARRRHMLPTDIPAALLSRCFAAPWRRRLAVNPAEGHQATRGDAITNKRKTKRCLTSNKIGERGTCA
jgi:hypothetical protein